jgi:putative ABC transport system permease protein
MELWVGAVSLGLIYAFVGVGVFLTFRVHNFPDITVDGSFTLGAAVGAVLLVAGVHPVLAVAAAFVAGALAGVATAIIHAKLNVNGLLAGILVMTALYSVNLRVMERSNIPLLSTRSCFTYLQAANPGMHSEVWCACGLLVLSLLFWVCMTLFLKTDLGMTMRAVGNNPDMAAANGVSVDAMKTLGLGLANGLTGVGGCLAAQYQGFADIGMGLGTVLMGLAAVIIGESVIPLASLWAKVFAVLLGSVIFRMMIAFALSAGMNPIELKLLTAFFVLLTLVASKGFSRQGGDSRGFLRALPGLVRGVKPRYVAAVLAVVVLGALGYRHFLRGAAPQEKGVRIGLMQFTSHEVLDSARDGFIEELNRLGYHPGRNCTLILENAHGEMPTVNTIADKFAAEKLDVVIAISTQCTQAAVNKIKDRPVVFTAVANPFVIGAGKSETDHLPNLTGVYGEAPMGRTVEVVHTLMPGKLRLGTLWNPALVNSMVHVTNLRNALVAYPDLTLVETHVASTAEVHDAASALALKGIDVFLLCSDSTVFSALDSVLKVARARHIPVFVSNLERLEEGTLGTVGFDFATGGVQAAQLMHRILSGEKPATIPLEHYRQERFALNLDAARQFGLTVPDALRERTTSIFENGKKRPGPAAASLLARGPAGATPGVPAPKRAAVLMFNDSAVLRAITDGLLDELKRSDVLRQQSITVDVKSAQNDFTLAQSIAQDMVRQRYDYIITVSTPALQVVAQVNKKIPHVFGAVTDPYRMGVAKSQNDHQPNLTGLATLQPVRDTIAAIRKILPDAKRIGMVWNPAEACSEACTYMARDAAKTYGFELIEATVSGTGEVPDALRSVLNRQVDAFLASGDNTVSLALQPMALALKEKRIPFFTNTPTDVRHGALLSLGADYVEVGRETGRVAARVIRGEDPQDIPIKDFVPQKMAVNQALAKEYGIVLPADILRQAADSETQP